MGSLSPLCITTPNFECAEIVMRIGLGFPCLLNICIFSQKLLLENTLKQMDLTLKCPSVVAAVELKTIKSEELKEGNL